MAAPENIGTLAGRIESFITQHHLAKRRASSLKKRAGGNAVTWPHAFLAAEQLAQAGFYYKPTSDSLDNAACFICHANLDGWEPGDDPFAEHLRHSHDCGWAVNASISRSLARGEELREDPMCERLVQAREATFHHSWPHEGRKGWKCKTQKMVEAGWCYDPSPEYDDCVRCFYCDLSLDGWEPKDDPLNEHRRRSPECRFFLLSEEFADSRPVTKGKKGRVSRASKVSRLSTQSNLTAFSEAPSLMSLGDAPAGQDDTMLSSVNGGIISAPKGRKTAKSAAKATRKASRTRNAPPTEVVVTELSSTPQIDEAPKPKDPPKRTTRRIASRAEASQIDLMGLDSQSSQTGKAKGKGRAKARVTEDESQLHLELQAAIDASVASSSTPKLERKTARGTKRSSDGAPKLESSVIVLEDAPPTSQYEKPKAKRGRKPKQPVTEPQHLPPSSEISASEHALKPIPKAKKSKPAPKRTPSEPEPVIAPPKPSTAARSPIPTPPVEPSPAPSTPTPAKPRSNTHNLHSVSAKPTKPTNPTPSPHSSDAENQPPSSRPQPARQGQRVPLTDVAGTPNGGPRLAAVRSTVAWTAADLEELFCLEASEGGEGNKEEEWSGGLREIVGRVRKGLSTEERSMSLEGWVRWNAARCEEGLRVRCEEMVMRFETEGARAMGVLEGIECV